MRRIGSFLSDAWRIAGPYWHSEERWRARLLLGVVVLLNLSLVGMSVLLSYWNREFFNALQEKDAASFWSLLFWGKVTDSGPMPGFVFVAALFILIAVYQLYLRQALQIRWRTWLTKQVLDRWLADRAYYRIALTDPGTDNPDQRVQDDIRLFVEKTLDLGFGLLRSVVTLVSFVFVLWGLSGTATILGIEIPGYMVWVALLYAVIGTALSHWIGRRLIPLNFNQQRVEADFRYALMRLRDNAEGVALYGGEADEKRGLTARFQALIENWWRIMVATKRLTFFQYGYTQVALVFPFVVASPAYFAGKIPLGGLTQTADAFGQVQGSLSWFVDSYRELTEWRATVVRITGFLDAIGAARGATQAGTGVRAEAEARPDLALDGVTLALPDGRVLIEGASARVAPGETVLVTGPSGSGKSTLFRAIAGIWPFGGGRVEVPKDASVLFLPQRPYLPLGSLQRAVCYPRSVTDFSEAEVRAALSDAGLGHLAPRLEEEDAWDRRLSGGEQQRLALARALLLRPQWLFLDEATASLDPEAEARFYQLLRERLPGTTLVSIAHRPAVAQYHARTLRVRDGRLEAAPA
ncbi:ABC transporter ATP-binding protein/permease [Paracraurococcus ruber]|uniref:ABC transporter ATP-binding protein n=1 Tax=Paracraurococcus ruber TaxID=77675 RepID=A0ABS1D3X8_9PROT|nr:ABC transporter ATP-binding protein/permease [Paracraurococcus ruber]MBK1661571.1 ABC transporter ATP-binding protein [Paracraurococcus ruber]TDG18953.1 ABC transporter ATP-binding protein/permease [Paracraurococcus ruber]